MELLGVIVERRAGAAGPRAAPGVLGTIGRGGAAMGSMPGVAGEAAICGGKAAIDLKNCTTTAKSTKMERLQKPKFGWWS